jgi:hypothetical protein
MFPASEDRELRVNAVMFAQTHEQGDGRHLRVAFAEVGRPVGRDHEAHERSLHRDLHA